MRSPSLQAAAAISVALHLTLFLVAAFVLRYSRNTVMPSPYEVSLVGPAGSSRGAAREEAPEASEPATKMAELEKKTSRPVKDTKADEKRLADRMTELASKKKVERIVSARKLITVGSRMPTSSIKSSQRAGTVVGSSPQGAGTYEDLIASRIGQEIVFPETGETQLATIVLVKIRKNGEIIIQGIEKGSGNVLFDRAALRAIEKANPVPPPPAEMEIGLKLHPYGTRK